MTRCYRSPLAPDIAQVLQPLQVQLVDLVRGQDHHVHQRLCAQPAVLQQPLHRSQHSLRQSLQLRARVDPFFPAEIRLSAGEEDAHQLHRALHHCHLRSEPLLLPPSPYVDARLRVVQPFRWLLRRLRGWVLLVGVGRVVLDVNQNPGLAGGSCPGEAEERLVWLVVNTPALVFEVCLVLRVVDDDLALRVDYLLLQLLQKLWLVPPAGGEGSAGTVQQRWALEEKGQQPFGPHQHANQFQLNSIIIHSPSNQMKSLLFLLLNLFLAAALFYAYYDSHKQHVAAVSQRECLNQQASRVFCTQCLRRSKQPALRPQKAFLISGAEHYAVLKIPGKAEHLACHEYLQLADYARGDQGARLPLQLEQIGSVIALMGELQGEYVGNAAGESVVSADFEQAVIYRWFSAAEEKNTPVKVADSSQMRELRKVLLGVVNGVILLLGGLYLRNKESFSHLKPKVLACIGLLLAGLDLLAFDLLADSPLPLAIVRQLILAACLMRVETSSGAVGFLVFLGLVCSLVPFGFLLNLLVVLVVVIAKGSNQQNVQEIWRYILGSLLIYAADHVAWQAMFVERGDIGCQFVELLVLGLTPLGLTLIKDAKYVGFKVYKGEQKRHSISLSGYEEEEEEEEQI